MGEGGKWENRGREVGSIGWELGGIGVQKYKRRENVVRGPPCPPPPLRMYSLIHVIIISNLSLLEIETLHFSPQPLNYLVGLRAVSSIQPLCSFWHMTINTSSNNHIWWVCDI